MADLRKTIDIVLNGEDKASRSIKNVRNSLGGLGSKFTAIASAGAVAATAIAAVGAAITALIGAGLKEAYDQAVDFESAMVDLEKVLGDHPAELEAAKVAAMELSNTYGVSSGQIIESIANWVQAGYDIQDATKLAEESIALMYTSELDAAEATTTLTKILKGFGIEVDDTRSKLDVVNEISNQYAANVGMLTEALARVAPIADAAGISFEEMSAILTPALEKFQNGEVVGRAFATILNRIVDDAKPVQDALAILGVEQKDANGELKSGRDILYEIGEAFQNLEPNQKQFVAQQLAGTEQSAKFLAVMNDWDTVSGVYQTAISSAGSITDELVAKLESAEKQIDRWNAAWENLSIVIGDQFKVAATEALSGGTDVVNAINSAVEGGAIDPFFNMLNEMSERLAITLDQIATSMPDALEDVDWQEFADSIGSIGEAFASWFGDLDLTKPDDLAEAIQNIVDTASTLADFTGNVISLLGPVLDFIVMLTGGFNEFYDQTIYVWNGVQAGIGLAASTILDWIQKLYEGLSLIPGVDLSSQVDSLEDMKTSLYDNVQKSLEDAREASEKLKESINNLPKEKRTEIELYPTGAMADAIHGDEGVVIPVKVDDEGTTDQVSKEVDNLAAKKIELDAKIETAEIERDTEKVKAVFETVQTSVEWKAKLEIEKVQAATQEIQSAFESVNTSIQSTGDSIGDVISALAGDLGTLDRWMFEEYFEDEAARRQEAFEQQKKLTDAEISLMNAREEALKNGDGLIRIESTGLEPELEAFMWKILEKVQVRANEESSEFLLGI